MLGGSVLSELSRYIDNPRGVWAALSSAIPASSNFFINYVSYRWVWGGVGFEVGLSGFGGRVGRGLERARAALGLRVQNERSER